MQMNTTQNLKSYIPIIDQIALSFGVNIEIGSDFRKFKNACRAATGKSDVGPAFDIDEFELNSQNALWMLGRRDNGEVVHTQAIKTVDLSKTTLKQHLQDHLGDFRVGGYDLDIEKSEWRLTPDASRISGLTTYHGELWLKDGPNGLRGGCLATVLTRLMLILGLLKWTPSNMIGIQAAATSCRGLAAREGYMRTEQRSILWHRRNHFEPIEGWLVWMTREEAEFNLSTHPDVLYNMLEGNDPPKLRVEEPMSKVA